MRRCSCSRSYVESTDATLRVDAQRRSLTAGLQLSTEAIATSKTLFARSTATIVPSMLAYFWFVLNCPEPIDSYSNRMLHRSTGRSPCQSGRRRVVGRDAIGLERNPAVGG